MTSMRGRRVANPMKVAREVGVDPLRLLLELLADAREDGNVSLVLEISKIVLPYLQPRLASVDVHAEMLKQTTLIVGLEEALQRALTQPMAAGDRTLLEEAQRAIDDGGLVIDITTGISAAPGSLSQREELSNHDDDFRLRQLSLLLRLPGRSNTPITPAAPGATPNTANCCYASFDMTGWTPYEAREAADGDQDPPAGRC